MGFDCFTYALEAAVAGQGLALGWRYFIDRSVQAGALLALGDGFVDTGNMYFGVLTENGRRKPLARRCLAFFRLGLRGFRAAVTRTADLRPPAAPVTA